MVLATDMEMALVDGEGQAEEGESRPRSSTTDRFTGTFNPQLLTTFEATLKLLTGVGLAKTSLSSFALVELQSACENMRPLVEASSASLDDLKEQIPSIRDSKMAVLALLTKKLKGDDTTEIALMTIEAYYEVNHDELKKNSNDLKKLVIEWGHLIGKLVASDSTLDKELAKMAADTQWKNSLEVFGVTVALLLAGGCAAAKFGWLSSPLGGSDMAEGGHELEANHKAASGEWSIGEAVVASLLSTSGMTYLMKTLKPDQALRRYFEIKLYLPAAVKELEAAKETLHGVQTVVEEHLQTTMDVKRGVESGLKGPHVESVEFYDVHKKFLKLVRGSDFLTEVGGAGAPKKMILDKSAYRQAAQSLQLYVDSLTPDTSDYLMSVWKKEIETYDNVLEVMMKFEEQAQALRIKFVELEEYSKKNK